jgi:hypothetical protein
VPVRLPLDAVAACWLGAAAGAAGFAFAGDCVGAASAFGGDSGALAFGCLGGAFVDDLSSPDDFLTTSSLVAFFSAGEAAAGGVVVVYRGA